MYISSSSLLALTFLLPATTCGSTTPFYPFLPPLPGDDDSFASITTDNGTADSEFDPFELRRRQSSGCSNSGFNACTALGADSVCCTSTATCALDQAGHVACCPTGKACTGTIAVSTLQSGSSKASKDSSTVLVLGGVTTSSSSASLSLASSSSGNSFVVSPTATGGFVAPSTISNTYFNFAALPTTFSNAAQCSSGYTACQTNYASCTAALGAGGSNNNNGGVTVAGPAGGITVQAPTTPSATLDPSAATSVCQSLSNAACHGLILTSCSAFGGVGNAAPTGCIPMGGVGLGVALGVGVVGQVWG